MKKILKTIALAISIVVISSLSPIRNNVGWLINQPVKAITVVEGGATVTRLESLDYIVYALLSNGEAQVYDASRAGGNITIPREVYGHKVTSIGNYAFPAHAEDTIYNVDGTISKYTRLIGNSTIQSVVVPDTIKVIGSGAFSYCSNLVSVELPNSLMSIKDSTFAFCKKLVSINVPESVTKIEDSAFWLCEALDNITITNSVTSIGNSAFVGCRKLKYVELTESVIELGEYAFDSSLVVKASEYIVDKQKTKMKVYLYDSNGVDMVASYYVESNTNMSTYIANMGADWEKVSGSDITKITQHSVYKLSGKTLESPTLIPSSTQVKNRQDGITITLN